LLVLPAQWPRAAAPETGPAQPGASHSSQRPAASGIFTVNTTADTPDADQGNPLCADASGKCSLRAAIMQANFATDPNTITVPSGVYLLTRPGDDDGDVVGDLDVTHDLAIQGAGAASTIVDGNGGVTHDRVFQILSSATNVSLSGLTIQGGVVTSTFAAGGGLLWSGGGDGRLSLSHVVIQKNRAYDSGGAALGFGGNDQSADLEDVTVYSNTAIAAVGGLDVSTANYEVNFLLHNSRIYSNAAYEGGGLYLDGDIDFPGSVTLDTDEIYSNSAGLSAGLENWAGFGTNPVQILNSRLHDNHASLQGGAIGNHGEIVISNTTLANNTAAIFGGGVYNYESARVTLAQSTLSGNSAQTGGGFYGELFIHSLSFITLTNSTVSSNLATHDGAGLFLVGGLARFFNATIANNQVRVPNGDPYAGLGAGVYISPSVIAEFQNTILAGNTHRYQAGPAVADDCKGIYDSNGYNLIQDATNCTLTGDTLTLYLSYNPLLGPLAYNGGPTQTQTPSLGSVVIDTAQTTMADCTTIPSVPLTTDQRGFARPRGPHCDIGAVEYYPPGPFLPLIRR
jgi:CSLREA domain-containing protein